MKDLLIITAANYWYTEYQNLWEYCIKKAYPEYDSHCYIAPQTSAPFYAACYRLLIDPGKYKYVYMTDIDMMILREERSLLEFHLNEMKDTGLCYSNTMRRGEPEAKERLTGLHFATREWYDKTCETRKKYLHMLNNGEIGNNRFDDEKMLMQICKNADLGLPGQRGQMVIRHHGIHLGTLRAYQNHSRNTMETQLLMRVSKKQAIQWLEFYKDSEFLKIIKNIKERQIRIQLDRLYSFCRRKENER